MNPYRDSRRSDADAPIPYLGVDPRLWPSLLRHTALVLILALLLAVFDRTEAIKVLVLSGPGIVVGAIIEVLRVPVGNWLAARRARAVVEGVAALEAKVASEHE